MKFDPNWLMAAMAFESAETFSASVRNPRSSAVGLIQFMSKTAFDLDTTTGALALMTAEDQLNYVYKYFKDWYGRIHSLADLYMAILWPKAVTADPSTPIFVEGTSAYAANAGLDQNNDHTVTKAEAASLVQKKLEKGLLPENVG